MANGGNPRAATAPQAAQAPQINQSQNPNIYSTAAGQLGQAGEAYGASAQYNPAQFGQQVSQFQNPYTSAVTDQTMTDIERQRQMAINTTGAQATAAGAFGGSRHGVAEALTNQGFADTSANMFANLNNQGFQNAAGNMFQAQNQSMQGAQGLANTANLGFGMGQQLQNQQWQQGAAQQAMQQQIIDAARGQFAGYTGSPNAGLATQLAAINGVPYGQTSTSSSSPGLLNVLSLGLGF